MGLFQVYKFYLIILKFLEGNQKPSQQFIDYDVESLTSDSDDDMDLDSSDSDDESTGFNSEYERVNLNIF